MNFTNTFNSDLTICLKDKRLEKHVIGLICCFTHWGAQWLPGRVLDLRPRDCGFESHRRHCVVSFSKTHLSLHCTGLTQEDFSLSYLKKC